MKPIECSFAHKRFASKKCCNGQSETARYSMVNAGGAQMFPSMTVFDNLRVIPRNGSTF
jgi:hypothetical protein